MKKTVVIYDEPDFRILPEQILLAIIEKAKKDYGCKFISRESGEELNEWAIRGLFIDAIERALNR